MSFDGELLKAKREFESNYKSYLENKLLFQILTEVTQPQLHNTNSINNSLSKKIEEHFLKSFLNVGNQLNSEQKALISQTKLDSECKAFLVKKIEQNFQVRHDELNEYYKFAENFDYASSSSFCNNSSLDITCNLDPHKITIKLNNLIESIDKSRQDIAKLANENSLKQERLYTQSIETISLLFKILREFKLEFYSLKNQVDCETEITECDMLLGKIQTVTDELKLDLYNSESLKALEKIQNQIEHEVNTARDEQNKVLNALNSYISLGDNFKYLLNDYFELKEKLDRKKWEISQLEENYNY